MKDDIESSILIISHYKILGVKLDYSQLAKDIDGELKLCKVRTPQTKGKCEIANKFE